MSNTTDLSPIDIRSEAFADFMADYPYASDVDSIDELPLQMFTADDTAEPFQARVLGFGSSYRKTHLNHTPGTRPGKGVRCSGCRWTDTAILRAANGYYVFVSLGKSVIPEEKQWNTVVWTTDAEDVFRKLFVPTKKDFRRDTGDKAIPPHNATAFRDAASIDPALADLLERAGSLVPEPVENGSDADPLAGL